MDLLTARIAELFHNQLFPNGIFYMMIWMASQALSDQSNVTIIPLSVFKRIRGYMYMTRFFLNLYDAVHYMYMTMYLNPIFFRCRESTIHPQGRYPFPG